jgi:hypothetical protein
MGATTPVAARKLLAQALDAAHSLKVWMLTWEPSTGNYSFGVQAAVKLEHGIGGQNTVRPLGRSDITH